MVRAVSTRVAVVLAAGVGSRLRPLTDDRPKALVSLGAETILARAVRLLRAHGVEKLVVATGYREDALRTALVAAPLEVVFCPNARYEATQNSVSLALCSAAVGGEAFFKLDGDVVFEATVLRRLDGVGGLAVAVDGRRKLDAEAMKVLVRDGRVTRFGKELSLDESAGESIGIERVGESLVGPLFTALDRAVTMGRTDLYYEALYDELIADGHVATPVDVSDLAWTEIDDHADLDRARALFPG